MCDEWQCPPLEVCWEILQYDGRAACATVGEQWRAGTGSLSVQTFAGVSETAEVSCSITLMAPTYVWQQNGPVCGYGPEYVCPQQ